VNKPLKLNHFLDHSFFSGFLTIYSSFNIIKADREEAKAKAKPKMKIAVITTATIFVVLGILVASYCLWKNKAKCAGN
jgi:hypothetical protein